mmetsp:Transcript_93507/g.264011  ORF Transcript_93507/g.264011 Transcript_93507/m.264011 type:complete len:289 (-) Transcript_93507:722-1588(-)
MTARSCKSKTKRGLGTAWSSIACVSGRSGLEWSGASLWCLGIGQALAEQVSNELPTSRKNRPTDVATPHDRHPANFKAQTAPRLFFASSVAVARGRRAGSQAPTLDVNSAPMAWSSTSCRTSSVANAQAILLSSCDEKPVIPASDWVAIRSNKPVSQIPVVANAQARFERFWNEKQPILHMEVRATDSNSSFAGKLTFAKDQTRLDNSCGLNCRMCTLASSLTMLKSSWLQAPRVAKDHDRVAKPCAENSVRLTMAHSARGRSTLSKCARRSSKYEVLASAQTQFARS